MPHMNGFTFTVDVKLTVILEALRKHKAEHILEYGEAKKEFRLQMLEKSKDTLARIKKEDFSQVTYNFGLTVPVNCVNSYDELINTFENVNDEVIEMKVQELNMIVNNSWDWLNIANQVNATYSSSLRGKMGNF